MMLQVNHAQTYKWLGENSEALSLLEKIDFSIAPTEYLFARSLILEDFEVSNSLLKELVNDSKYSQEMTIYQYCTWPLSKEYTLSNEFSELLNEYNLSKDILKPYTSEELVKKKKV